MAFLYEILENPTVLLPPIIKLRRPSLAKPILLLEIETIIDVGKNILVFIIRTKVVAIERTAALPLTLMAILRWPPETNFRYVLLLQA